MSESPESLSPKLAPTTDPSDPLAKLDALRATWARPPRPREHENRINLHFGGNVPKYLKDWQQIRAYFEEKGLPCHSFAGTETDRCITTHAYVDAGEDDGPVPHPKVVSMMGVVDPQTILPDSVHFDGKRAQADSSFGDVVWISVPEDAVEKHHATGWAV
ncbi:hypothetical protein LEL_08775 [Akanthomyces lecanii RCEF 1005]|uniref:Uncharacterized protein n=1 Tax=Akanthomyces lecanii RCEF 1005 TaxID=1081108 RepID=A0A168DTM7_CORDF|nr:hypothetical protein LEL_08775 [Akanthomyces lecanii RCEF 1005]